MKTELRLLRLLALASLSTAVGGQCQGTFWLRNYVVLAGVEAPVVDAPVYDAQGGLLNDPNYRVALYGGLDISSLRPAVNFNSVNPYRVPVQNGYFNGTSTTLVVGDTTPDLWTWVQVRAWDTTLGASYEDVVSRNIGGYGQSSILYCQGTLGPFDPLPQFPAPLIGLTSFSVSPVVPEPGASALLALGGVVFGSALLGKQLRAKPNERN